jgi:hypothetical protein
VHTPLFHDEMAPQAFENIPLPKKGKNRPPLTIHELLAAFRACITRFQSSHKFNLAGLILSEASFLTPDSRKDYTNSGF